MSFQNILTNKWLSGIVYLGVAAASGILSSTIVLLRLPANESGLFFLCQAIMAFVLLFDFGLLLTSTREFAFEVGRNAKSDGNDTEPRQRLSDTFAMYRDARMVSVFLLICLGGAFALALWLFPQLGASANASAAVLASLGGCIVLMSYIHQAVLEGGGYYYIERYLAAVGMIISTILIILASELGGRALYVFGAWYLGYTITLIMKMLAAARIFPDLRFWSLPNLSYVWTALKRSSSIALLQFGAAVTKYLQYPIIAHFMGLNLLGGYFFVTRIATTMDQAVAIISVSQRSMLSRAIGAGDYEKAHSLAIRVAIQVAIGAALMGLMVILVLPLVIKVLFSKYDIGHVPFLVIGLDLFSLCLSGSLAQIVIASGRNPFHRMMLVTAVLTVGLLFVLVPNFGLLGAALSQAIAGAATNFWFSLWQFFKTTRHFKQMANAGAPG